MSAATVNQELDSSLIKALRLLHSSDSDSEDQLRQLWRQSVLEKYGPSRAPTSVLHKIHIPTSFKRSYCDDSDLDELIGSKKLKSDGTRSSKSSPSTSLRNSPSLFSSNEIEISSESDENDNDSPIEMLNASGCCVKCKTSFSSVNNKLVECTDCQKHYHQECHFPPITDMDLNDPRLVWYCSSCEENISSTSERIKDSSSAKPSSSTKSVRTFGLTYSKSATSSSNSKSYDSSPKRTLSSSNDKSHSLSKKSSAFKKLDHKKTSK